MIWAGCFEEIFKVIGRLSCLALRIMLGSSDELLAGVVSVLVIITPVVAGGNPDSLWLLLQPFLSLLAPLLAPLLVA
jgi:hypothetical protein